MPEEWYDELAELWNQIIDNSFALPSSWVHVGATLTPKADDASQSRPISIAALAWRVCSSATVHRLRPWADKWAHPDLFGRYRGVYKLIGKFEDLPKRLQDLMLSLKLVQLDRHHDHPAWYAKTETT